MINNIKVYCLQLRLINPNYYILYSKERNESGYYNGSERFHFYRIDQKENIAYRTSSSVYKDGQFIMYQTLGISLVHKSRHTINQRYREKGHVDKKNSDEFIPKHQKITGNRDKNHYDFFVPETILSPRRRRELRILICFNSRSLGFQSCWIEVR